MKFSCQYWIEEFSGLLTKIQCARDGVALPFEEAVRAVSELVLERGKRGGKTLFIGNGGSAAISSHGAVDLMRVAQVQAMAFNDHVALTCFANDEGYEEVFRRQLFFHGQPNDILIAISSSGQSRNILNGVETVKQKGGMAVTLSGFKEDNPLRSTGSINFYVPSSDYQMVEGVHQFIVDLFLKAVCFGRSK